MPPSPQKAKHNFSTISSTQKALRRFSAPTLPLIQNATSPSRPYGIPSSPLSSKFQDHSAEFTPIPTREKHRHSITPFINLAGLGRLRTPAAPHPIKAVKAALKTYHSGTSHAHTKPAVRQAPSKGPFRQQAYEARCIQIIAPGLYVAFEDDNRAFATALGAPSSKKLSHPEDLLTRDGLSFTHIIALSHQSSRSGRERCSSIEHADPETRVKYLHLSLPPLPAFGTHKFERQLMSLGLTLTSECDPNEYPLMNYEREKYIHVLDLIEERRLPQLYPQQFEEAKYFIHESGYNYRNLQSPLPVRILITTPRDGRADAMALLAVYLAFATGRAVEDILHLMDSKESLMSVWKETVGKEWVDDLQQLVWK
jgi:hypothetical protein